MPPAQLRDSHPAEQLTESQTRSRTKSRVPFAVGCLQCQVGHCLHSLGTKMDHAQSHCPPWGHVQCRGWLSLRGSGGTGGSGSPGTWALPGLRSTSWAGLPTNSWAVIPWNSASQGTTLNCPPQQHLPLAGAVCRCGRVSLGAPGSPLGAVHIDGAPTPDGEVLNDTEPLPGTL